MSKVEVAKEDFKRKFLNPGYNWSQDYKTVFKNHPEILADENLNENKLKEEKIENLFIMNNENNEGFGVVKLPVKVYGGNPTEFAEFMMEYHQMAVAHGMNEKTMIQRLPIYLKGMAITMCSQQIC